MRALTILSALLLAMAGGAYAALVVTAGGSDAGEFMVVLPVKPAPVRPAAPPPLAPAVSPGASQAPASVSSATTPASAPSGGQAVAGTGSAVAGMIAEQPQQRQPSSSAAAATSAQAPTTQLPATLSAPGLSIDLGSAGNVVSGQPAPARSPSPGRATPGNAPAGLGARPAGG